VSTDVATGVGQALRRAVDGGAADLGGVLPHDLAEVAPLVEVGHVRVFLAVELIVEGDLAVVEQLGDDRRDIVSLNTSSDVLAVFAAVDVPMKSQWP